MKHFLPTFSFLGNLIKAAPTVSQSLVTHYGETLEMTLRVIQGHVAPSSSSLFLSLFIFSLQSIIKKGTSVSSSLNTSVNFISSCGE